MEQIYYLITEYQMPIAQIDKVNYIFNVTILIYKA